MMIKVILFDADGVAISTTEKFGNYYAKTYGVSVEKMKPFYSGIFLEAIMGRADLKEILQPYLKDWKWEKSVDEFLQEWFLFEHKINKPLIADVKKLREQGIRCYIATNQEKYRTNYITKEMGFGEIFDGVFSSADVGSMKQNSKFFHYILDKLAPVKAEEMLFWDDEMSKLEAAQSVGIQVEQYFSYEDFLKKMDLYLKSI